MNTWLKKILSFALFSGIISGSFFASAQTPAAPAAAAPAGSAKAGKPAGEKKKSLSFEDELVSGATAKPELELLLTTKNVNFKRLIKLRENFQPEMRRTSEDVGRGRGSN